MAEKMTQASDQQLWLVNGPDWTLPVSAIPIKMEGSDTEYMAVSDVIGFSLDQHEAVNAILSPAAIKSSDQFLVIPALGLPSVATKAPGINARYYVRWKNQSPQRPEMVFGLDDIQERPEPSAATKEFLNQVAWRARSMSKEDVMFVWQCIVDEMPAWLTERRKPISFGYFVAWALPYRANWKQILLSKFPAIASTMRMPKEKRDARLSLGEVERELHNTDLVEFNTHGKCAGWSLECVPTKHWAEYVADAETKRRMRLGPTGYAKFWDRLIWKLTETIYDIFGAFVSKTVIPCAEPVRSGNNGSYCLGPATPPGKSRALGEGTLESSVVYYDNSRTVVNAGTPGYLEAKTPSVSSVQPLRLPEEDVRDNRGILQAATELEA